MPANQLYLTHIMPLTFRQINPVESPKYVSPRMDQHFFADTVQPWQQPVKYYQPYQTTDTINLQYKTKVGPLYLNVYNCYGARVQQVLFTQKQRDRFDVNVFIWEVSYPLSDLQPGIYYFTLQISDAELYKSEPIDLQERHDNSLLIEYGGAGLREGVYFGTGLIYQLRMYGSRKYTPASVTVGYIDQTRNATIISDTPYRVWTFNIGFTKGVPDYFIDKLNRVFGCEILSIDGILYSKTEDSKLEESINLERYPMRWWDIELSESLNRNAVIYEDNIPTNARVTVAANVETKAFGEGDNNGIIVVTNVE